MNRSTLIRSTLLLTCLLLITMNISAQENRAHNLGMAVSIQESQTGLLFPWWISSKVTLTPSVAYSSLSDVGSNLDLGMGIRFNQGSGDVIPYFGARFGLSWDMPEGGDTQTMKLVGAMAGGEYFLNDRFSLGVEGQFNVLFWKQDMYFGEESYTLTSTGAVAFAAFYF